MKSLRNAFYRWSAVFLLFGLMANPCSAQQSSLLWEISGDKLAKPSYLYGTIHVSDQRVFQFGDSVIWAFRKAEAAAFELDMKKSNIMQMASRMVIKDSSESLKNLLKKKDYERLTALAKKQMGPMAGFVDQIKPFYVYAFLLQGNEEVKQPSAENSQALDLAMQDKARSLGKIIVGIEEMAEQMEAIDKLPIEDQVDLVRRQLRNPQKEEDNMEELILMYLSQDLEGLNELMASEGGTAAMMNALIDNRNYKMSERIDTLVQNRSAFIAIGAGHLSGDDGVINLLRKSGYRLRPMQAPFNAIKEED